MRIQWDPERGLHLQPLAHRTIQIGLSSQALHRYCDDWIVGIDDVTPLSRQVYALVQARDLAGARALLPAEQPYPDPVSPV